MDTQAALQKIAKKSTGKGKKGRKVGRNRKWCQEYRARGQRMKNKIRKVARHLKRHPNDEAAAAWITSSSILG